ncbi:hypothetical protein Lser_V15G11334 [Lactuca serriola]
MMVDGLEARIAMGMYMGIHNPTTLRSAPSFLRTKLRAKPSAALIASSSRTEGRTVGGLLLQPKHDLNEVKGDDDTVNNIIIKKKKRVFFLDVNPICYDGSTPSLHSFAHWIFLFFSQVSLTDLLLSEDAFWVMKQMVFLEFNIWDVNVRIQEEWLHKRHKQNDSEIISSFLDLLGETRCSKALWIHI